MDEFNGEEILVDHSYNISEVTELRIMTEMLQVGLKLLTEEDRTLIMQHFFEGKSQTELGRIYGVNQSNVSRRIARILIKLKNFLEK